MFVSIFAPEIIPLPHTAVNAGNVVTKSVPQWEAASVNAALTAPPRYKGVILKGWGESRL
ncbi:MAG: hypothetical protein ACK40X_06785 [Armatimonadota bacterium]